MNDSQAIRWELQGLSMHKDLGCKGYNFDRRSVMKKIFMVAMLGLSVILSGCGLLIGIFGRGTRIDLPGEDPIGLQGKAIDVGLSGAGRPEPMSSRVAVSLSKAIDPATFADATGISAKLGEYGLSVSNFTAWGACLKFTGTAVLTTTITPIPATITLGDVSAELNLKDAAVPNGINFTLKTDPANTSVPLNNTAGTNTYSFDADKLHFCARVEGATLVQIIGVLEGGGTNTISGTLKYSLDGVSALTSGSLKLTFGVGNSYIIL